METNQNSGQNLSPQRINEKADILESNLFKTISKQKESAVLHFKIKRANFPNEVIYKALLQLFPRFTIKPREFILGLRNILQKNIEPDKEEKFKKVLGEENEGVLFEDLSDAARKFEAIATQTHLEIFVHGLPVKQSLNGEIAKSFFSHEKSPGKLSRNGLINFKEINKFPIVNSGDNLFYITHEKQGQQGLSFDGKIIPVELATPFNINIGPGVKRIDDLDEFGQSKGYFLKSELTGVVLLDRDDKDHVKSISINDEVEIQKLDYSTGNIGSQYTCPVSMKIGVICHGFKLRVNGKVETMVLDGGEIITNNEARITKAQADSVVMALKDITIDAATRSKLISEKGTITINTELIDSKISSPKVIFDKTKGLATNNAFETEHLALKGLYFSGENIIHFGNNLFVEKEKLQKTRESIQSKIRDLENNEKLLMGKLQLELKRLIKISSSNTDLIKHIKPIIMATKTMDFKLIFEQMDLIQKRNNTKVVFNVRKIFEVLENIPKEMLDQSKKVNKCNEELNLMGQRMGAMKLTIEGYLRRAGTIKIFCGITDKKKIPKPDLMIESDQKENKYIQITATYSHQTGFEFVR